MSDVSKDSLDPVTVIARHTVRRGDEAAFESWSRGIAKVSQGFAGYLGTQVIRPTSAENNEFVSIFRFDTCPHLEAWMESSEREDWLSRTDEFSDERPTVDYHSLEFWFSPEETQGRAPSKHKMALVTFAVIWPMVHFIPAAVVDLIGPRLLLAEAASVGIIVLLMTYAVMPTVSRVLRPWLVPKSG